MKTKEPIARFLCDLSGDDWSQGKIYWRAMAKELTAVLICAGWRPTKEGKTDGE